jgi:carboxymethylenebutenolidase
VERKKATDFPQGLLDLFDHYIHGEISRRQFLDSAAKYAVGGLTAVAIWDSLRPDYALAEQVPPDDKRLKTEYATVPSPQGNGSIRGYFVRPANAGGKLPGVLVLHENRGLNPYIEDVARRLGTANFLAFAPDGLTSVGGYPGDDEKGAELFPDLAAAVPFYGRQPSAADAAKIKAPLLLHYASLDTRITGGWPAYEEALKANHVPYTVYIYEGVNHGFHNDTTPRYDESAAKLAWQRTLDFLNKYLR